ncbi:MAG: type II toxin-antitoxin system death-on-curing family toxin [Candidatus Cloacimonetes bacterium]|jgi:death-on-curing protein|nr:type II toxin-antitoxin system death-on-curing family toxin [Candidatus Cloacimonadota bacterium]
MNINYFGFETLIRIYQKTIEVSGGGSSGIKDQGQIESVLQHIQNDLYYPTFKDKLTHLFFSLNKFHCFSDGNKRIAISAGVLFLNLNGFIFRVADFITEMENISYHLAAGKIDKELLKEIITAVLYDDMENEELKLKVLTAIK